MLLLHRKSQKYELIWKEKRTTSVATPSTVPTPHQQQDQQVAVRPYKRSIEPNEQPLNISQPQHNINNNNAFANVNGVIHPAPVQPQRTMQNTYMQYGVTDRPISYTPNVAYTPQQHPQSKTIHPYMPQQQPTSSYRPMSNVAQPLHDNRCTQYMNRPTTNVGQGM